MKKLLSTLAVLSLLISLPSCASKSNEERGTESNPVKIGVMDDSNPQWAILKDGLAADGIYVAYTNFTDYTSENPALSRGELDINLFQHLDYLDNYNKDQNDTLTPIGATAIFPLGLYANDKAGVSKLDDIKEGATIVIPNDETNQSRAIDLLRVNGLVEVKDVEDTPYTPDKILSSSKVVVKSVAANQTAHSLSDKSVAAAIINNDYLDDADLKTATPLIRETDDTDAVKRYINVWAVKKVDENDEVINKVVSFASNSQAFTDAIIEASGGTAVIVAQKYTKEQLIQMFADISSGKI